MTMFGTQRLYQADRMPEPGERIELAPAQLEIDLEGDGGLGYPTSLPPTLDKLLHGMDTAPNEDPWIIPPKPRPTPAESKAERRWFKRRQPDEGKTEKPNRKARRAAKKAHKRAQRAKARRSRRESVAFCVELAGIGAISAGFWLIAPFCGLICLGLCLILMGVAISRPDGS